MEQNKRGLSPKIVVVLGCIVIAITTTVVLFINLPSKKLAQQLDLGTQYLSELDYEQAIVAFTQAIQIDPKSTEAYMGLAEAYVALEDYDNALTILQQGYEATGDERLKSKLVEVGALDGFVPWFAAGLPDHVMDWEDPVLESRMQELTGIDGDIMLSDVWEIRYLRLTNESSWIENTKKIRNINALGELVNLKVLMLDYHAISDISSLESLTNLKTLVLGANNISDISALESLTQLQDLGLNDNNISDISALRNLVNLEVLILGENKISDFSVIEGLVNLRQLALFNWGIKDASVLEGLTNLEFLNLSNTNITDISKLENLKNLKWLTLYGNNIDDIGVLKNMPHLEYLNLEHNQISDISVLECLKNLKEVYLRGNDIIDYSPVSHVAEVNIE